MKYSNNFHFKAEEWFFKQTFTKFTRIIDKKTISLSKRNYALTKIQFDSDRSRNENESSCKVEYLKNN